MTAAVLHGREDLRIEQVPMPKAGAGEIVVRVHAALTCGTDLKVYRRGYHARMLKPPIPFGHELAGTVHQVGRGVAAFRAGDRVVALNSAPAATATTAATIRKTSATASSSTTAPTRNSSSSLPASSQRTPSASHRHLL